MNDLKQLDIDELEDLSQGSGPDAAAASYELSQRYKEGRGVTQDDEQAELWYKRAKSLGFAEDDLSVSDKKSEDTVKSEEPADSHYNDYISGKYYKMMISDLKSLSESDDFYATLTLGKKYSENGDYDQASVYFEIVKSFLESSSENEKLLYDLNIAMGENYKKIAESGRDTSAINKAVACFKNALDLDISKDDPKRYKYLLSVYNNWNLGSKEEIEQLNKLDAHNSSQKCIEFAEDLLKNGKITDAVEMLQLSLVSADAKDHPEAVAIARLLLGDLKKYDSDGNIPDIKEEIQNCAKFFITESSEYMINNFPTENYSQLSDFLSENPEYDDFCWDNLDFKPAKDAITKEYGSGISDKVMNLSSDKVNILLDFAGDNKEQVLRNMAASGNAYAASIIREEREKKEREEAERIRQAAIQQQEELKKKQAEEEKKKAKTKRIIIGSVIAAAVIIVLIVANSIINRPTIVDPFPYVSVSYDGVNGYGKASVDIDSAAFAVEAEKDTGNKPFTAKLSPSKNLSNGDKITVTLNPGKSLSSSKIQLEKTKETVTVSGLKDAKTVDVFKDISVEFSGLDGSGSAKVVNNSTDPFVKKMDFEVDPSSGLKSGDTITVKVKADDDIISEYQEIPSEKEKTYTVDALEKYPDDINEISADSFQSISDEYTPQLKNYMLGSANYMDFARVVGKVSDGDWYFGTGYADTHVIDSIKLVKAYLVQSNASHPNVYSQNDTKKSKTSFKDVMFLIYEVDGHAGSHVGKGYVTVQYSDITIDPQGNIKSISRFSTLNSEVNASSSIENAYSENVAEYANSGTLSERNF